MVKIAKLSAAALVTALVCFVFLYATRPELVHALYRCTAGAVSPIDCYLGKPTAFRTVTFGMIYEGITDNVADRHVLALGAWEKPQLLFLRAVSRGGIFVDVGANKGLYSVFMSKYSSKVHAFEPYEPAIKKFRHYIAINRIDNIVIHSVGLGEKHEWLTFENPPGPNIGLGSFAFVSDKGSHEKLKIVTGDKALADAGINEVDLIKMDIEGFERPALRGLAGTLGRSRPIVLFELTLNGTDNAVLFNSEEQLRNAFPSGYEFFVFMAGNLYTGDYQLGPMKLNFDGGLQQYNVVAFPAEKRDRIPVQSP